MSQEVAHEAEKGIVQRLLSRLEDWARGNDLDALPQHERDRIAHDVGLTREELQRLAHVEADAARLLHARLAQLGFTADDIERMGLATVRDLERTCGLCGERTLCAHDLAERPEAGDWRQICPNYATMQEMERKLAERGAAAGAT